MSEKRSYAYIGISLPEIIFCIFLVFKLAGIGAIASWDWLWVFSPIWIPLGIALGLILFVAIVVLIVNGIQALMDSHPSKVNLELERYKSMMD